ncbi:hypothetical protein B0H17DRAFT_1138234 [Mycena rosella]|uniref:Uncharacterized protein n=1 Tax=Mycena rosella TaxID=1033263 RepID=A0AAD7D6U5_MYCRO|nr:hypothetical protein B0H17DRAFT_1138234 [Mycena rosella]
MPGGLGPDNDTGMVIQTNAARGENAGIQPITKENYLAAIMNSAYIITENDPKFELAGMEWNPLTLEKGILVVDDPKAQVRMRIWPNIFENMDSIEDLLNLAIFYGIPFNIFYKMSEIPLFQEQSQVTDLERKTLPGTLEPGYPDTKLTWAGNGADTLAKYLDLVATLLTRPYAGAFLMKGGGWIKLYPSGWLSDRLPV